MSYFDEVLIETPGEREAFEQLHRAQMIKRMATIARNAPTTSAEAICERLYDAGCKFND